MEIEKVITYRINGQEYHSLEEMPEKLRLLFEDKNQDGVPDILEGTGVAVKRIVRVGSAKDLSSAPSEVQEAFQQVQSGPATVQSTPRPLQFEGPTTLQRIFFFVLIIAAVGYVLVTVVFRPGP